MSDKVPARRATARWRGVGAWNIAVLVSAAIVVLLVLVTAIGWLASHHSKVTMYSVSSPLRQVDLRLSSGQAVIVGSSSSAVQVRRTDDFAFGHAAREQRSLAHGVLSISSRCPRIVLGSCSASYELAVPETVAVNVITTDGHVRLDGFRGTAALQTGTGNVDVEAYCGFKLSAVSASGDVHVATACAPQSLDLRTGSGNAVALVPPGRYRLAAVSGSGRQRVSGVVRDQQAPFSIDVHSGSGSAAVQGGL
jgi:hypothetical protein